MCHLKLDVIYNKIIDREIFLNVKKNKTTFTNGRKETKYS